MSTSTALGTAVRRSAATRPTPKPRGPASATCRLGHHARHRHVQDGLVPWVMPRVVGIEAREDLAPIRAAPGRRHLLPLIVEIDVAANPVSSRSPAGVRLPLAATPNVS